MTPLPSPFDLIATADYAFVEPERLGWLWLVAACAVVMLVSELVHRRLRRRLFTAFGSPRFAHASDARIAEAGKFRRWMIVGSRLAALALVVLALADPRGGAGPIPVKPVNLQTVVLLDRSRSMAARDARPSRFEAGQEFVRRLVEEAGGGAVALVSFAGVPRIEMPLTRDYQGLIERLDRLAPSDGPAAGTDLQAGLETAATCFAERMASPKLLVVISDGETHGVEPDLSTTPLPRGTDVLVIGVGDADQGARIPIDRSNPESAGAESFLIHDGELVRSRANPQLLRVIADGLEGEYVAAESAPAAVAELLQRTLRGSRETAERAYRRQAAPRFHWLLFAALGLLGLEMRLAQSRTSTVAGLDSSRPLQRPAAWLLLVTATTLLNGQLLSGQQSNNEPFTVANESPTAPPPTPARQISVRELSQLYNAGVEAYRGGRWRQAEALFNRVRQRGDGELRSKARFNLANTQYTIVNRGGISKQEAITRLETAIELYRQNLAEGQRSADARANIEITYRRLRQIEQQSPDSQSGDGDSGQNGSRQNGSRQNGSRQNGSGQGGSGQNGSGQNGSGQNGSGQRGPGGAGSEDRGAGDAGAGNRGSGTAPGPTAPPQASPESDLDEPLGDQEAEDQLRRIRQRARESERKDGEEQEPPAEAVPTPGGLPW